MTCKVEGCAAPRYVFPGGSRAAYCKQHLPLRQQGSRRGLPPMTDRQQQVLITLRDALRADVPFLSLPTISKRTITALMDRDWIFYSPGLDGVKYKITSRGLHALAVYEAPGTRHSDGLCPRCRLHPKQVLPTGFSYPYCEECQRKRNRRTYALKGYQLNPETPCSRCKKRRRHQYPSGKVIAYCTHCRKVMRKREKKRKMKRLLEKIAAGQPPICLKCDQPRHHTARVVYDYCYEHYREYQRTYQKRWQRDHRPPRKARLIDDISWAVIEIAS